MAGSGFTGYTPTRASGIVSDAYTQGRDAKAVQVSGALRASCILQGNDHVEASSVALCLGGVGDDTRRRSIGGDGLWP